MTCQRSWDFVVVVAAREKCALSNVHFRDVVKILQENNMKKISWSVGVFMPNCSHWNMVSYATFFVCLSSLDQNSDLIIREVYFGRNL